MEGVGVDFVGYLLTHVYLSSIIFIVWQKLLQSAFRHIRFLTFSALRLPCLFSLIHDYKGLLLTGCLRTVT
jgi:hypothetical protein